MDYDPYENRPYANLNYYDALVNMVRCVFGTGILAMPLAFKNVGWLMGFLATAVIILIMTHTVHILVRGITEMSRRHQVPYMSFEKAMSEGILEGPPSLHRFRQFAEYFVLFFLLGFYLGVGSAYMVFMADSVNKMLEIHFTPVDSRLILCCEIIPLLIIFLVRNLKALVPFSMAANIALFAAVFAILYFVVRGLPPLENRRAFNDMSDLPLFMGTVLFASSSLGVFLAIEANMIKPRNYISVFGVLNVSMVINYATISLFAFFGYWKYGDEIQGSITLNIAKDSILSQSITVAFVIAIYISYSLQCSVIVDIVWVKGISSRYPPEKQYGYEILLRLTIVITTALIAICLPKFDLIISLVGCVAVTVLNICFPAILDMCLRYPGNFGPFDIFLYRDILLLVFGVFSCVMGVIGAFLY